MSSMRMRMTLGGDEGPRYCWPARVAEEIAIRSPTATERECRDGTGGSSDSSRFNRGLSCAGQNAGGRQLREHAMVLTCHCSRNIGKAAQAEPGATASGSA